MNQDAKERISIIKMLKPIFYIREQSMDKRIKKIGFFGPLIYLLANLFLIILMVLSAIAFLHNDSPGESWQKSGILVFMILNLSFHAHYTYIEYLLLKHARNLKNQEYSISYLNNNELKKLVIRLNNNRFKPYWIVIPSMLVMLGSILSYLEFNPYWEIFALPALLVGALLSWRLNNEVWLIRNNIKHSESQVNINSIIS